MKTTKVNIFFGELNYQTISQIKAYDFASLLGDIGGQMGLFIGIVHSRINSLKDFFRKIVYFGSFSKNERPEGASILTLMEFMEYCVQTFVAKTTKLAPKCGSFDKVFVDEN